MSGCGIYDVLVCGAGVSGLASARALSDLGLRVLVVDRQRAFLDIDKGEVLQPGALRVLRSWGTEQLLRERGAVPLDKLVVREPDGAAVATLDYGQLPEGDRQLLAHHHPTILTALTDGLSPGVEIRRGVVAREVLRDGTGRVTGLLLDQGATSEEVYAPLVVAADGIGSRLRCTAGIEEQRTQYPHRLVSLDIVDPAWCPEDFSAYLSSRGLRLAYPLPGGRLRLYLQTRPHELRGLGHGHLLDWATQALMEIPALGGLVPSLAAAVDRRQIFSVASLQAERLMVPGMALMGEAALAVHPMAAQGMNAAITSAAALAKQIGRRLGNQIRGGILTPPRLDAATVDAALTAYQAELLPILARTAQTSANAARMLTDLSWLGRLIGRRALRRTGGNPRLLHTLTYNMSGLGPRPLTALDRLQQIGLLPDRHAHHVQAGSTPPAP